ncbi:anthocyanidin 3-O-glucosyltransferase 6-like [Chenopodium quinoa]|nr:anthocyanidin 3-O-glucosyltransferase 6-like [Chenopodium quinoa]
MPRMFRQSKGILINTFMELESYVIRVLIDQSKSKSKVPSIYPVGPILSLDGRSQHEVQDQDLIMEWLDEQPLSSVVFLCFGSMGGFDVDQVTEIANGLDRSGFRFLWSLPQSAPKVNLGSSMENYNLFEALPEGFVDRMAHRGKIIKWAPQVQILAHRAIGGFVTHCGWNSILESLWFGVPMATWPMCADQQLNAFELVKELGLGVEFSINYRLNFMIGKGNYLVTAEEVENGVKRLMNMDEEIRDKLREISDLSRKALKDGGSSNYELIRFIEDFLHN